MQVKEKYIIPIKLVQIDNHGAHILVKCRFGRKNGFALIDTGASQSVFDKNSVLFAGNKFTRIEEENQSSGINSNINEMYYSKLRHFAIGKLVLKQFEAVFIPFDHINLMYQSIGQDNITGIIGGDLLLKYQAEISYSKHVLCLTLNIE